MRVFGPSVHSNSSWKEKIYFGSLMFSFFVPTSARWGLCYRKKIQ